MKGSTHVLLGDGRGKNLDMFLLRKGSFKWLLNSDMVKPEKFGYLHLIYHFTVPPKEWVIWILWTEALPIQHQAIYSGCYAD